MANKVPWFCTRSDCFSDMPLRCYTYPHVLRNAIYGGTKRQERSANVSAHRPG